MLQRVTNQLLQLLGIVPALPSHAGVSRSPSGLGKQKWPPKYFQEKKKNNKRTGLQMQKCLLSVKFVRSTSSQFLFTVED